MPLLTPPVSLPVSAALICSRVLHSSPIAQASAAVQAHIAVSVDVCDCDADQEPGLNS